MYIIICFAADDTVNCLRSTFLNIIIYDLMAYKSWDII